MNHAKSFKDSCPPVMFRVLELAAEKGASSWLTCCPLRRYGVVLNKQAFRDSLHLRYGWIPSGLPSTCTCGASFTPAHTLSCPLGGYPSMRHNDLRDLTASLLKDVAHDVSTEPSLQPITGETLRHRTAISADGAHLDMAASGIWGGRFEKTSASSTLMHAPTASSHFQLHTENTKLRRDARMRSESMELSARHLCRGSLECIWRIRESRVRRNSTSSYI